MGKIYVRPAVGGHARVVDEDSPLILDGLRRGEIVHVPTATPADAQAGRVTTEDIRRGAVVVTNGDELKPPVVRAEGTTSWAAKIDAGNRAQERQRHNEQEQVNDRAQTDPDSLKPKFIFMEDVGAGSGKAMTMEQFLASDFLGRVRASTLRERHQIPLELINSGRVKVIDD
ncbi:MAG: hypothetical protein L6R28_14705 [Planctomycetes bacterium]|nr:hypothetical protein [Planctomycetota bacterium]